MPHLFSLGEQKLSHVNVQVVYNILMKVIYSNGWIERLNEKFRWGSPSTVYTVKFVNKSSNLKKERGLDAGKPMSLEKD